MFGPQKGATPDGVASLEESFHRLLTLTGDTEQHLTPGSGAAGGCGWGFAHFLGATIIDGAQTVADLIGATEAISHADAVVTGEGKFDATSMTGKVTGAIIALAKQNKIPIGVIAGSIDAHRLEVPTASLVEEAGSVDLAMLTPQIFSQQAARALAPTLVS